MMSRIIMFILLGAFVISGCVSIEDRAQRVRSQYPQWDEATVQKVAAKQGPSGKNAELADQLVGTIHEFVDRLHERAAGIEKVAGKGSMPNISERASAKIDKEVNRLQGFVEKNPMMAALAAFGFGAISTRILKGQEEAADTDEAEGKD